MVAGVCVSTSPIAAVAAQVAATGALSAARLSRADAALVFTTGEHAQYSEALLRAVQEITSAPAICACSVSGLLTHEREYERGPALGVLVFGGLRARSRIAAPDQAFAEADEVTLALVDPRAMRPELLVALDRQSGAVVGAGASADPEALFVGAGNTAAHGRVALLSFSGIRAHVTVTHACTPMGPSGAITRVKGRAILEIDGKPAAKRFIQAARDSWISRK